MVYISRSASPIQHYTLSLRYILALCSKMFVYIPGTMQPLISQLLERRQGLNPRLTFLAHLIVLVEPMHG
jgi:hypothetical protein